MGELDRVDDADHQDHADQEQSAFQPTHQLEVRRYNGQTTEFALDHVAEERPVALVFNGISHAVMMATPCDLEDFAIGFCLSEQIVDQRGEIYDVAVNMSVTGIELQMTIAASCFARLKEQRRNLIGRTGCGLCGVESLSAFEKAILPVTNHQQFSAQALAVAFAALPSRQPINQLTGAMHAAAWVDANGHILFVREDVGRHNALDKLIGALASQQRTIKTERPAQQVHQPVHQQAGFAIMSSRASYELVQKAARANIGLLATISAPTALAIKIADAAGICLVGFVRERGFVVYANEARLCW